MDVLLAIKILIFIYIIISPFISYEWLSFINITPIKVILLVVIVILSFVDLQLAILAMIAFLILLVNLNKLEIIKMKEIIILEDPKNQDIIENMINKLKEGKEGDDDDDEEEERKNEKKHQGKIKEKEEMYGYGYVSRGKLPLPLPEEEVYPTKPTEPIQAMIDRSVVTKYKEEMVRSQTFPKEIIEKFDEDTMSNFPKPYCNMVEYDKNLISEGIYDYSLDKRTKPYEEYIKKLSPNASIDSIQTNEFI